MEETPEYLATCVAMGTASDGQRNALATVCRDYALVVAKSAVKRRLLLACDVDDMAQLAAVKAMASVAKWQLQRGSWKTFVGVIARSAILDQRRRYAKEAELKADLSSMLDETDSEE